MKRIYFDYAATTPVDKQVLKIMMPYFDKIFANTSSIHSFGVKADQALQKSRKKIADLLQVEAEDIIFTGSATESNNLAIKGFAFANKNKGNHILVSSVEHDCVLGSASWLKTQGFEVDFIPVEKDGTAKVDFIKKSIRKETILVSVIHANNEIGTINPIKQIGEICKQNKVIFHTDAVQSFGKIPVDIKQNNIDMLTASSHKMYGPKGAALLFIKKGINLIPILHGGGHEKGLRSSTVNVAAIVGFAQACELCFGQMNNEAERLVNFRDKLIQGILATIPDSHLNGNPKKRLPNNINVRFDGIEGEGLVMLLDEKGIACSTGSACSSASLSPSHVLLACGIDAGHAHGSLRISLGRWTREKDIEYMLKVLPSVVKKLRNISPFFKKGN
jgi:cysteine desulfurase